MKWPDIVSALSWVSSILFAGAVFLMPNSLQVAPRGTVGEIMFSSDSAQSASGEFSVINADGSSRKRLANGAIPSWSPDGNKIAFVDRFVYIMNYDGTNSQQLTNGANVGDDYSPTWSPDGKQIAFVELFDSSTYAELDVVDVATKNLRSLAQLGAVFSPPAWSPDGKHIAFNASSDGHYETYIINADGGNFQMLPDVPAGGDAPAWSPDGNLIAFSSGRSIDPQICIMQVDGSNEKCLTNEGGNGLPTWSPNGEMIAFVSDRGDNNTRIYLMTLDGKIRPLTTGNFDTEPSWSPDGKRLAFVSERDGYDEIYVIDTDGSAENRLTYDKGRNTSPSWRPETQSVVSLDSMGSGLG